MANAVDFHMAFMLYQAGFLPQNSVVVPQRIYKNNGAFDPTTARRRLFYENGVPGVSLARAVAGHHRLTHVTREPLIDRARITLRVCWPGIPDWEHAMDIFNRAPQTFYSDAELAHAVAVRIERFQQDRRQSSPGAEPQWDIRRLRLEDLYLVELRQVAAGSWQPVIYYVPPVAR